jgi:hypothetical protein
MLGGTGSDIPTAEQVAAALDSAIMSLLANHAQSRQG